MKSAITKSGRRSSLSWGTSTTRQMDTPRNRCQAIPAHVNGCSAMDMIYRKSAQQVENCEIRTFGGSQSSKMRTKFTILYNKVKNMRTGTDVALYSTSLFDFLRGCVSRVLLERPKHEDGTETLG